MSNDPSLPDNSHFHGRVWFELVVDRTKEAADFTLDQKKAAWSDQLSNIGWNGNDPLDLCLAHLMIGNFDKAQELLKQNLVPDSAVEKDIADRESAHNEAMGDDKRSE